MQKTTCLACGIEKDMNIKEMYPYSDDSIDTEEPVSPLFKDFECQSDTDHSDFRLVTICHKCWHRVQPDMWMSQREWESLNPITNFNDLPKSPNNQDASTNTKEVA